MSTPERDLDATAYLLGELDAEQQAVFERALADDAALRAEVERLRPVVARLDALPAEAWDGGVEPPPLRLPAELLAEASPAARQTTDAQPEAAAGGLASEPELHGARRRARPERRRRRLRGPLVVRPAFATMAAAALLAIGVGFGMLIDGDASSPTQPTPTQQAQRAVTLQPLDKALPAQGRALVADAGGQQRVTLRLRGLPPSRARQFYEVWLMDASGPLIAIGSFRVGADGRATLQLPLPVQATSYQYFDISVQPEGDDANHSGESILRGATA